MDMTELVIVPFGLIVVFVIGACILSCQQRWVAWLLGHAEHVLFYSGVVLLLFYIYLKYQAYEPRAPMPHVLELLRKQYAIDAPNAKEMIADYHKQLEILKVEDELMKSYRDQAFPISTSLIYGLFGTAIGLFGARQLAKRQLASKLLERFNSNEMYASRRKAFQEQLLWYAGDRNLLHNHLLIQPINHVVYRERVETDRGIGVGQVLGFLNELHEYYQLKLISDESLIRLFQDRFSWFANYFISIRTEMEKLTSGIIGNARYRAGYPYTLFPYASRQGITERSHDTITWMIKILKLNHSSADFEQAYPQSASLNHDILLPDGSVMYKHPIIQGLKSPGDLNDFLPLIIPSPSTPHLVNLLDSSGFTLPENYKHNNDDKMHKHIILRVHRSGIDTQKTRWRFVLDVGCPTQQGYIRSWQYLEDEEGKVDWDKVYHWYWRLLLQTEPCNSVTSPLQCRYRLVNDPTDIPFVTIGDPTAKT